MLCALFLVALSLPTFPPQLALFPTMLGGERAAEEGRKRDRKEKKEDRKEGRNE